MMLNKADHTSLLLHYEILEKEIIRLRDGKFTPEEFQNLCHNLNLYSICKRADFENGCIDYQDKLFGPKKRLIIQHKLEDTPINRDIQEMDSKFRALIMYEKNFFEKADAVLEFGKTYKLTIEEVE